jgi:hypothetical protein
MALYYQASPRQSDNGYPIQPIEALNVMESYSTATHPQFGASDRNQNQAKELSTGPGELQTADKTAQEHPDSGHYYVDGDGARLPHVSKRRVRRSSRSTSFSTPASHTDVSGRDSSRYGFPEYSQALDLNATSPSTSSTSMDTDMYDSILNQFHQTCVHSSHFNSFETANFPSIQILDSFVKSYFDSFQPILPFIHPGTFVVSNAHWLLILALAAIGSHYVAVENAVLYETALHEFLRRAVDSVV